MKNVLTAFVFCSIDGPSPKTLATVGGLHNLISLPDFAVVAIARDSIICYAEPDTSNKLGASFQTPFGRRLVCFHYNVKLSMMNLKFSFFVSSVVLAAGVLQWVEWRATPKHVQESESCLSYGCLSFYDAFYFVIVTVNDLHFSPCSHQSEYLTLPPKSAYILDPANK